MADLKIYNNGEGKILFSAGDRIIRQPYNFGNAATNKSFYWGVKVSPAPFLSDNYTFMQWYNQKTPQSGRKVAYVFTDQTRFDQIEISSITSSIDQWFFSTLNDIRRQSRQLPDINTSDLFLARFVKENNELTGFVDRAAKGGTHVDTGDPYYINEVYLGMYNGVNPSSYCNTESLRGTTILFNRAISQGEFNYFYNNKIGSDPQSLIGCVCYFEFNRAEILDFSTSQDGSDMRVGVRDFSGNNHHGEIMNLPAGTLQEQLDWANANLFVPFIS